MFIGEEDFLKDRKAACLKADSLSSENRERWKNGGGVKWKQNPEDTDSGDIEQHPSPGISPKESKQSLPLRQRKRKRPWTQIHEI